MKVAFISDQIYPRSSADAEQIISSLSSLGKIAKVVLISFGYKFSKKPSKFDLESYFGKKCTFDLAFVPILFKNIRSFEKVYFALKAVFRFGNKDFDVIYTRNIPVLMAFIILTNKKLVFESYRPWPDRNLQSKIFFKWLSKHERLIGIVSHSNFAKNSFLNVGFNPNQILVAHNAFDLNAYKPRNREEIRNELDIPSEKLLVTYSGRVSVKKGLLSFIKLARTFPEIQFLIVGSEKNGEIEKQASELENVLVLGWKKKDYVFSILKASDILYIPPTLIARDKAKNTVLPLKTFMYKASSSVIFGPNSEDVSEVLAHKKTAYLVKPDNWEEELEGFKALIKNNDLRFKIAEAARKEMINQTWDTRAADIHNFIEEKL